MPKQKPPAPTSQGIQRVLDGLEERIAEHGHAIVSVAMDPENRAPAFSYTAGLADAGLPELLVLGLAASVAQPVLNQLAGQLKRDGALPTDTPLEAFAGGLSAVVREVPLEECRGHVRLAHRRRGNDLRVLQVFWPDPQGRFPWEEGFDARYGALQRLSSLH